MQPSTANARIVRIDSVPLTAKRPRAVGRNAVSGPQGDTITEPIVRLTTDTGVVGWARSTPSREMAEGLVGKRLSEVFSIQNGTVMGYDFFDTVLWDLVGQLEGKAVHELLRSRDSEAYGVADRDPASAAPSNAARVYHSAIYFEDLDPETNKPRSLEYLAEAIEDGIQAGY